MKRVIARMLDETEFLSQSGIRALSRYHLAQPFELISDGKTFRIGYEPAEPISYVIFDQRRSIGPENGRSSP